MFRKFHIQMTVFSTAITGIILLILTGACLVISENSLTKSSYISFKNNAQSCIYHLESQQLVSHTWILKTESSYGIHLRILDRGQPIFFDQLNPQSDYDGAFSKAEKISIQKYGLDISALRSSSSLTEDHFFKMNGYYVCTAQIPNKNGSLGLIILYPLDSLEHKIASQRLAFSLAVCAALLALGIFSWFFTGRMIHPLKENRKKQTEFIAAASHELRSPVTVILSAAASMEQAEPSELPHFMAMIRSEAERISRLVQDLLSLANADNQNWSIHLNPVEADTLLLDTFEKYEPLMQAKNLHFQITIPEEPIFPCLLDQGRISQVLDILLDNALSYVPANGRIRLSLSEEKGYLIFTISDNGPGIPEESRKEVFRRFYRIDSSRKDKQHFGLGLSIAREIVSLHGGTITVSETPGGGATFTMLLPKQSSNSKNG